MSRKDKMYLVAGVPGHWPNACRKEGRREFCNRRCALLEVASTPRDHRRIEVVFVS